MLNILNHLGLANVLEEEDISLQPLSETLVNFKNDKSEVIGEYMR